MIEIAHAEASAAILAHVEAHMREIATRYAKALGYAEVMLGAISILADDPAAVRAAVAKTKAEIARICAGGEVRGR
jgi:hypothetical protein